MGRVGNDPALFSFERVRGIRHAGEVETFRRADRTASCAILGVKRARNVVRRPRPCANPLERADEAAHLVVQEASCADVKPEFYSAGVGQGFHPQFIQRLLRAVGLTHGRTERGEIVLADQPVRARLHRLLRSGCGQVAKRAGKQQVRGFAPSFDGAPCCLTGRIPPSPPNDYFSLRRRFLSLK